MKTLWIIISIICVQFLISGCSNTTTENHDAVFTFPQKDILFQANVGYSNALGFMNADGSSIELVPTADRRLVQPVWSTDKNRIYFRTVQRDPGLQTLGYGDVGMLENESVKATQCGINANAWIVFPLQDPDTIIYSNGVELALLDFATCKKGKTILVAHEGVGITSFSLSKDRHKIIYGETKLLDASGKTAYTIYMTDLDDVQPKKVTAGINPTLSPNNQQIAFSRKDGIYLANSDGSDVRRLVRYESSHFPNFEPLPPVPNWSPDGKWLVYHKCGKGLICNVGDEFSLFKYDLDKGVETRLYDGGMFPNWP
jgi:Tol biopolymer transport system component